MSDAHAPIGVPPIGRVPRRLRPDWRRRLVSMPPSSKNPRASRVQRGHHKRQALTRGEDMAGAYVSAVLLILKSSRSTARQVAVRLADRAECVWRLDQRHPRISSSEYEN